MSYARALRCRKCGQEYPVQPINLCDFCLSPLEVSYDYKAMARELSREKLAGGPTSMWRYRDMLSGEGVDLVSLPVGTHTSIGKEVTLEITQIGKECHIGCAIYRSDRQVHHAQGRSIC